MDDFRIEGIREPFDPTKIERIGEENKEKLQKKELPKKTPPLYVMMIVQFCLSAKKILAKFPSLEKISFKRLKEALHELELSFQELSEKDLSENAQFLQELSMHWMKVAKNFQPFFARQDDLSKNIQQFLNDIHSYPPGAEFSLGYYLSKFAGLDWIPFPYINMLKTLFQNHCKDPQNSLLKKWMGQLKSFQE